MTREQMNDILKGYDMAIEDIDSGFVMDIVLGTNDYSILTKIKKEVAEEVLTVLQEYLAMERETIKTAMEEMLEEVDDDE